MTQHGCGSTGVNNCGAPALSAVNCFGVKPDQGTAKVAAFGSTWADPASLGGSSGAVSCTSCSAGQFARVPEVFHVSDGYNVALANAAGVCQALGARLASVFELQAAQSRGAEWCSCGWSSDGTARYPMQVMRHAID